MWPAASYGKIGVVGLGFCRKGTGDFIGTTISGMTGRGSIRHNNRSFSAANVDRSRSGQNVTFCNEDLKKVYHELFDEALAAYNAKKKKTRDKIPDYYEHIRQSKQEKLFHEAIFQIGNLTDCGCGSPGGERAAAALKEFAESFQERNPHLRVFNMVLHMDEATPHLHVDFVPVATEQSRGLSTRVSMKQALKQQGFEGLGRKQTEWKAWMEREKEALTEIAQAHEFEIISLGGGRPHMELPEYRAAAQRLEAVQEQVIAAEQEIAALEKQRKALQGNVKLLESGLVHTVTLKQTECRKNNKKIAVAVYLYQADNDGEWGELRFDFESGAAEIVRLADWDTVESNVFAKAAIQFVQGLPEARLLKSVVVPFEMGVPEKPVLPVSAAKALKGNPAHTISLRQTECRKTGETITAAVYEYLVDNDGEWGELRFDFENGTAEIVRLADWDTMKSNVFAKAAIQYMRYLLRQASAKQVIVLYVK